MQEQEKQEYIEVLSERSAFYRLLASLYFKEATVELIDVLAKQPIPDGLDPESLLYQGYHGMKHYMTRRGPDPRTDLAVDYARVFLSAGTYEGEAANPYESIYTSEEGLIMQDARDDVRKIFITQGVNVNGELNLPEDHLAFELEFLAIMSDRAAEAVSADDTKTLADNLQVQRDFMNDHLLNWLPILQERIEGCAKLKFYPAICLITRGYVEEDVKLVEDMLDDIRS